MGDMHFSQGDGESHVVELCEDDEFIILACDGVWDVMSSQQVVDFIHEHNKVDKNLLTVREKALSKCLPPSTTFGEGCDNMTIIIVQFKKRSENKDLSGI
jgi:protein phosphatase 1G